MLKYLWNLNQTTDKHVVFLTKIITFAKYFYQGNFKFESKSEK